MSSPKCPEGKFLGLGKCPACVAERTRWDQAYTVAQDDAAAMREWADRGPWARDEDYAAERAQRRRVGW